MVGGRDLMMSVALCWRAYFSVKGWIEFLMKFFSIQLDFELLRGEICFL